MWPSSEVPVPKAMTGSAVRGADPDDRRHLLGRGGEGDGVGRVAGVVGQVLAVLLADRRRGREPVAEQAAELGERRGGVGAGRGRHCWSPAGSGAILPQVAAGVISALQSRGGRAHSRALRAGGPAMDLFDSRAPRPRQRPRALFRLQGRRRDPLPRRQRLRRLQRRERRLSRGHLRRGRRDRGDGRRRAAPRSPRCWSSPTARRRSRPAAAAGRSSPSSPQPEAPVILAGLGGELARTTVGALLPGAFAPAHMERGASHDRPRAPPRPGRSPAST